MERQVMKSSTLDLITEQLTRSRYKYPDNRHMLSALTDSLGSLAKAMLCGDHEAAIKEAAQVAALAVRMIEEGDVTFSGWPRKPRG